MPDSVRERQQRYRAQQRAKGLKLVQMWLPDPDDPKFIEEARRASLAIANSPTEEEDQAFIESIAAWPDDEE
ncbi:MAG: antitoxin MazE-like protein [Pacificimonas sp.]|nr:antitoxin MazE-like protein [Pacificimonas sp.]